MSRYSYSNRYKVEDCDIIKVSDYKYKGLAPNRILTLYFGHDQQSFGIMAQELGFGGTRYWFICPRCDKAVFKLYSPANKEYYCRICWNLTYESRFASKFGRKHGFSSYGTFSKFYDLGNRIKRKIYRGKPTKGYVRFKRLEAMLERDTELYRKFMDIADKK